MVTEDIELTKKIFEMVSDGICDNYESFYFRSYVYDLYTVQNIRTTFNGVENRSVKTDFNGVIVDNCLRQLQANAANRGEGWCGFIMEFKKGGEVKVKFVYDYPSED